MTTPNLTQPLTEYILTEIGCGTAAEAIMAVRYNTSPPGPTYIPSLDDALLHHRPHSACSSFRRGDLVELVGPSGCGKTSLITFLLMTTLLPSSLSHPHEISLGGKSSHAMIFQPATHLPIVPGLRKAMKAHVISCVPFAANDVVEAVIKESMSRLRVWRGKPRYKDIALGLRSVLNQISPFAHPDRHYHGGLDLLILDGLGDGYYPQRWADEERGRKAPSVFGRIVGPEDVGMRQVMEAIGMIRKDLGSVVVMSVQGLRTSRESNPFYLSHLPAPYPNPFLSNSLLPLNPQLPSNKANPTYWPLNIQLTLSGPARGLQLPGDITLVDALRAKDREEREKEKGEWRSERYEGFVRLTNKDNNTMDQNGTSFHFSIGEEGLQVWGDS
ncbi:hypothetical protein L204_103804 [Cryptococcus depauperatus]|nr:hypothetical protein L204_02959 [Cryptococcus depauperatus CBS 7855]